MPKKLSPFVLNTRLKPMAVLVALSLGAGVQAQQAEPSEDKKEGRATLQLDKVVVTGTTTGRSRADSRPTTS